MTSPSNSDSLSQGFWFKLAEESNVQRSSDPMDDMVERAGFLKQSFEAILSQEILKELEHIKIMHDQHPLQVNNCAILKSAIEARISFWKGEQK